MSLLLPALLAAAAASLARADPLTGGNITVLVFGDSWGSLGPSWHEIQDTFDAKGVKATVRSTAKGGTQACQWAAQGTPGMAMAVAAAKAFPEVNGKIDFVWYSLGGNDFAEKCVLVLPVLLLLLSVVVVLLHVVLMLLLLIAPLPFRWYQLCDRKAKTMAENLSCMERIAAVVTNCTSSMLTPFWKASPKTRVMQCGYDLSCMGSASNPKQCLPSNRIPFCKCNVSCSTEATVAWQKPLLEPLAAKFPLYTGLNVLGTVQAAGGVVGASTGHLVMTQGSPCELMTVHSGIAVVDSLLVIPPCC